ncbi:YdcF family protein [Kribbella sp. NBC_01245]|uniref:YdcF family protein n=1 Tax=Kribbella sp. NBC_01245 TaxID=2903578 RepID=UPI002E29AD1F|nr:YdcF family protein [Kribbella sp. NBC_01245]
MTDEQRLISDYLARRDVDDLTAPVDVIVLMGSAVLESIAVTADAYHRGITRHILVSGGIGHSTEHLYQAVRRSHPAIATTGRPEAHVIADILRNEYAVPAEALAIEDRSTNCGENAAYSRELTAQRDRVPGGLVETFLLVQDPTMQRRTHACFDRAYADRPGTRLLSYAPLIPWLGPAGASAGPGQPVIWPAARFTSLLLGEIRRLHDTPTGYGPRGANHIDHIDIPTPVLTAYHHLAATHQALIRPAGA